MLREPRSIEWPTLVLLIVTYAVFAFGTTYAFALHPVVGIVITGVAIAQYSSLQHEVLHGHPFRTAWLNEALVFPGLVLTVPYQRFRAVHLAHHHDPSLTDPYDDPESNYLDPVVWSVLGPVARAVMRFNNTLLGRMLVGPLIGTFVWLRDEARLIVAGDRAARQGWLLHLGGLVLLFGWLWLAQMPFWAYLLAVWIGHALLKVRTFAEHRAHELCRARTVVVEDRGPLALLFLNNNLHAVHHSHPNVAWYRLPRLYAQNREHYLRRNEGYVFRSYRQLFARHLLQAKDPVPHPLRPAAAVRRAAPAAPMACPAD